MLPEGVVMGYRVELGADYVERRFTVFKRITRDDPLVIVRETGEVSRAEGYQEELSEHSDEDLLEWCRLYARCARSWSSALAEADRINRVEVEGP